MPSSVTVIENWAPLDELTAAGPSTGWAAAHGLAGRTVLLYSGTLGLKHNPALLLELARAMGRRDDARVVVISEGRGADWLRAATAEAPEPALVLLPFQPYDVLAEVLASADVLLAILEPEAGAFSVPSKVLSYHCAGTPILAAIPGENLAARIIVGAGSGVVVEPTDEAAFVRGGRRTARRPGRASASWAAEPAPTPRTPSTSSPSPPVRARSSPGPATDPPQPLHRRT